MMNEYSHIACELCKWVAGVRVSVCINESTAVVVVVRRQVCVCSKEGQRPLQYYTYICFKAEKTYLL